MITFLLVVALICLWCYMQHRLDIENVYSRCVTLHYGCEGQYMFFDNGGDSLQIQGPYFNEYIISPVGAAVIKRLKDAKIPVHAR